MNASRTEKDPCSSSAIQRRFPRSRALIQLLQLSWSPTILQSNFENLHFSWSHYLWQLILTNCEILQTILLQTGRAKYLWNSQIFLVQGQIFMKNDMFWWLSHIFGRSSAVLSATSLLSSNISGSFFHEYLAKPFLFSLFRLHCILSTKAFKIEKWENMGTNYTPPRKWTVAFF